MGTRITTAMGGPGVCMQVSRLDPAISWCCACLHAASLMCTLCCFAGAMAQPSPCSSSSMLPWCGRDPQLSPRGGLYAYPLYQCEGVHVWNCSQTLAHGCVQDKQIYRVQADSLGWA